MFSKLSRRNRVLVSLFAVFVVALVGFRLTRPKPTSEQQIRANMNELSQAMQNTSPRGMLQYLSPDSKWNKMSRDEVERLVRQASAGAARVEVTRSNEQIQVRGDEATASGNYTIRYHLLQESKGAPANSTSGQYSILWQKQNGEWLITAMEGGENSSNGAPDSESIF